MTLYTEYKNQSLTLWQRPDGSWGVRFKRKTDHKALHIAIGDALVLTTKSGQFREVIVVRAFVPHFRYGTYTRSGHILTEL